MSWFGAVEPAPPIEVFSLTADYNEDSFEEKVNLSIGAYRDNDGNPWVLPVVRTVEGSMAMDHTLNHEYLPMAGLGDYRAAAMRLLLGSDCPAIVQNRADGIQSIGGTGALRIGMDFLHNVVHADTLYISTPTWGNHAGIAKSVGFNAIKKYRYWNDDDRRLDIDGMVDDLKDAAEGSIIILHMCAHNPSGIDPTPEQWIRIADVMREKRLFPFFDCAYQGFATGDLDNDAWPVRYFVKQGFEIFAAQSFSKNFGLYNERVGCLTFVTNNPDAMLSVRTQLIVKARTTWSNSPAHGSRIVATVLNNPDFCAEWKQHVRTMAERILEMRKKLYEKLRALGTPGTWSHIIEQSGMFSYTGLSTNQCRQLISQYHIYLLQSGRINMCGLTQKNMNYVANAIHDVVTNMAPEPKL